MSRTAPAPTVVQQRDIPAAIRRLDTLDRTDYADVFVATADHTATKPAEQWVRDVFDGAPVRVQLVLLGALVAQAALLGMRSGWRIAGRGEGWVRLEAASPFITGHVLFHRDGRRVSFATFVRYDRRVGALVWPPVSILHRRVARMLARRAATVV